MSQAGQADWESRTHFVAIAAQHMRQILVDYARRQRAANRGDGATMISLEDVQAASNPKSVDLLASMKHSISSRRWTHAKPGRWS